LGKSSCGWLNLPKKHEKKDQRLEEEQWGMVDGNMKQ